MFGPDRQVCLAGGWRQARDLELLRTNLRARPRMPMWQELLCAIEDQQPVTGLTHNFYKYPARFSPSFARQIVLALLRNSAAESRCIACLSNSAGEPHTSQFLSPAKCIFSECLILGVHSRTAEGPAGLIKRQRVKSLLNKHQAT
jgi:hypothetical protein